MPLVVLCDDNGQSTGEHLEKEQAHTGKGVHHLAITVLLYNAQGQVLLQKRKHLRFDGIWDLTGATDIYHKDDGDDETPVEATIRCLKREYGVEGVDLKEIGAFNYFAPDGKFSENEFCFLVIGEYNGEIKLNPEVGYSYRWVSKSDFLKETKNSPDTFSPWTLGSIPLLEKINFFS